MKEFTITIKPLTRERISDVLSSALDGGSNYWIKKIRIIEPSSWEFDSEPKRDDGHWIHDYPLNPGGELWIVADDADDGVLILDWNAIQKGLNILAEKYPQCLADILSEDDDADTGDVLLQCCLFEDVIYG